MPIIRKQCKKIFGKQPIDTVNPDTAVAVGAAIQGALMQGILGGLNLADVTPLSLGIGVQGGHCLTMIPRNTKVPARVAKMLTTSGPNQREISIHVVQGESRFAFENKSLGFFKLTDIPPAPRGKPRIAVTLDVDADSIVHVSAVDEDTGDKKSLEIFASSGLSSDALNKLVREGKTLEQETQRREEKIRDREAELAERQAKDAELKNRRDLEKFVENIETESIKTLRDNLRTLIFETQFQLDTQGKRFKGEARELLEHTLQYARQNLEHSKTEEDLRNSLEEITNLTKPFQEFLENQ